MAVTETLTLGPDADPNDGFYRIQNLGGNGRRSPSHLGVARERANGDASGGALTINFQLDRIYAQVCANIQTRITGATADVLLSTRLSVGGGVTGTDNDNIQIGQTATFITSNSGFNCFALWTPPPVIIDPNDYNESLNLPNNQSIQVSTANVGVGFDMQVSIRMYYFEKGAKENVPVENLFGGLLRGTNVT